MSIHCKSRNPKAHTYDNIGYSATNEARLSNSLESEAL